MPWRFTRNESGLPPALSPQHEHCDAGWPFPSRIGSAFPWGRGCPATGAFIRRRGTGEGPLRPRIPKRHPFQADFDDPSAPKTGQHAEYSSAGNEQTGWRGKKRCRKGCADSHQRSPSQPQPCSHRRIADGQNKRYRIAQRNPHEQEALTGCGARLYDQTYESHL